MLFYLKISISYLFTFCSGIFRKENIQTLLNPTKDNQDISLYFCAGIKVLYLISERNKCVQFLNIFQVCFLVKCHAEKSLL